MQNFQLDNCEPSIKVDLGIKEELVMEMCEGINEFDWPRDTLDTPLEQPFVEETELPNDIAREQLNNFIDSSSVFHRLQHINNNEQHCPQTLPFLDSDQFPNLLEKLVSRNLVNMLSVTIYSDDKPYCLRLMGSGGNVIQESYHPVQQDFLMEYIDRQEIPPSLAEEWEQIFPQLFYNGCVFVCLWDARFCDTPIRRCSILKPHTQSIISDVNSLVNGDMDTVFTERLTMESYLVNSIQGDLCLDPSVRTGIRRFNQHFCDYALYSTPLCKVVAKNDQRKVKNRQVIKYSTMPLLDFIRNRNRNRASAP